MVRALGIAAVGLLLAVGISAGEQTKLLPAAPVNPFNGMQQREETFEFEQQPAVQKAGDKWVITFATTAACDATVSILDKDGRIVRHLASGVLGKNAPWPFQQNSLTQKLEWDGLTTDFKPANPDGCTVRVSLGLKPEFERNIMWDPKDLCGFSHKGGKLWPGDQYLSARGLDGTIYVIDANGSKTMDPNGRAFDKDGKYLRTFFPPSAKDTEKFMAQQGWKFATTVWGDKVVIGGTYGFLDGSHGDTRGKEVDDYAKDPLAALKDQPGAGEAKLGPRPPEIPASSIPVIKGRRESYSASLTFLDKCCRMTVDPRREEVYVGYIKSAGMLRINGETGELDMSWFPDGSLAPVNECCFGPDGLLYMRVGTMGYGQWIIRLDHDGKPVPFGEDAVDLPGTTWTKGEEKYGEMQGNKFGGMSVRPAGLGKAGPIKALWTGETHHSNTHTRGLYVSQNGMIIAGILFQGPSTRPKYLLDKGLPEPRTSPWGHESFVSLMDRDGRFFSANSVGSTCNGHNVFMDRDGNIYSGVGGLLGVKDKPYGIADGGSCGDWGGFASLVKFHWNGKIPLTTFDYSAGTKGLGTRPGTLWLLPGMLPGYAQSCTCHNNRADMDDWGRTWIGANQLYSLVVVDANGNMMGRFGRYGNVDDADEQYGKLHFSWIRAVAVSDKAVYADDQPNRRIVKAALKYAAEETVPLPR